MLSNHVSATEAGIATAMPAAVVSSASQMPPASVGGVGLRTAVLQGLKGGDHAQNGAQQAQQRRDGHDQVQRAQAGAQLGQQGAARCARSPRGRRRRAGRRRAGGIAARAQPARSAARGEPDIARRDRPPGQSAIASLGTRPPDQAPPAPTGARASTGSAPASPPTAPRSPRAPGRRSADSEVGAYPPSCPPPRAAERSTPSGLRVKWAVMPKTCREIAPGVSTASGGPSAHDAALSHQDQPRCSAARPAPGRAARRAPSALPPAQARQRPASWRSGAPGSRPAMGSSARISGVSCASARAIRTRACSPPDRSVAGRCAEAGQVHGRSARSTAARSASAGALTGGQMRRAAQRRPAFRP